MALPDQAVFEDLMYRAQRFMCVRGHARDAKLPEENFEAYEFNVKIDLSDIPEAQAKANACEKILVGSFQKAVSEAMAIWPWIKKIHQVGRSGGWAVVEVEAPGFQQWVPEFHDETLGNDHRNLIWMAIRHRVEDLEAIAEFIQDEQKTLKRTLPGMLKK